MKRPIFNERVVRAIFLLTVVFWTGRSFADGGTSDPDYDYLPPEEMGFFASFSAYATSWIRTPSHAGSFATAKRRLYAHVKDQYSFYCRCDLDLENRSFDRASCGYVPANDTVRAQRTEAEHIMPAFWIAELHVGPSCWVKDEATCGDARDCCQANDPRFKRAHNDLINLTPAIGELNAIRNDFAYGVIPGEPRRFGGCDFESDRDLQVTEPADDIRGDIARVYFYMRDTYDLVLPDDLMSLLADWDVSDPVSEKEVDRNERIRDIQGTANDYVSD
ncbi:endonuclease [Roseibium sp. MMSF_3412]|uniref:endonuclease n=1 Tax=Roseibium sp. MMSF_3412 TaxID=3046712 RepID=UPI00273E203F|nr:endonuclease [Roseibium sp. MMSF_3412]